MSSLSLTIVTPHGPIESELDITALTVPGGAGEMGVLPGHTSMAATLKPGLVHYDVVGEKSISVFTSGGYVDVQGSNVTLLLDVLEEASGVDFPRARNAQKRAMERLSSSSSMDLDVPRALASLERAQARLQLEHR
ncbi:MAG: ATP synthase F1 subunit epsilon [Oligoflexales bacterium]